MALDMIGENETTSEYLTRTRDARVKDEKGRLPIDSMSIEEMVRENLIIARSTQDLVEKFFTDLTTGNIALPGPLGMFAKFLK